MFLGAYHFDGDPDAMLGRYQSLVAGFPAGALALHICVATAGFIHARLGRPGRLSGRWIASARSSYRVPSAAKASSPADPPTTRAPAGPIGRPAQPEAYPG